MSGSDMRIGYMLKGSSEGCTVNYPYLLSPIMSDVPSLVKNKVFFQEHEIS